MDFLIRVFHLKITPNAYGGHEIEKIFSTLRPYIKLRNLHVKLSNSNTLSNAVIFCFACDDMIEYVGVCGGLWMDFILTCRIVSSDFKNFLKCLTTKSVPLRYLIFSAKILSKL